MKDDGRAMKRPSLSVWILIALVAGIAFGAIFPGPAKEFGLLGTIFLRLIKSIIAPLLLIRNNARTECDPLRRRIGPVRPQWPSA